MNKIILIFLALMLIWPVSALSLNENVVTSGIVPELNNPATVELVIKEVVAGTYNVYTLNDVLIKPESNFELENGTNVVNLKIYPTSALDIEGLYAFTYTLMKSTGEKYNSKLVVDIVPISEAFEISSDSNIPEGDKIRFYVENKANANFSNLTFKFSSLLFNLEETFDLAAFEKKEFKVKVGDLNKIEAGSYLIEADILTLEGIKTLEGKIYLGEKKGVETSQDLSGLLIRTETINKINNGNVVEDISVFIERGLFSRLFTTFNIEPISVEVNGATVSYGWSSKLGPGEIFVVKAKTNYLVPSLILLALALVVWSYKKYTTKKLVILKSVAPVRTKGGQFALRVRLVLKAKENLKNVSLVDKIPQMVKVHEKFETSKPDKVDFKSRRIEWNLGDLQTGEERSFSYVIYSKIGIVGKFALPEAVSLFEKEGDIHEVKSNSVFFLSKQNLKD